MNHKNVWDYWIHQLMNRPSKEKKPVLNIVEASVLANKETIILDEFSGYTKTRIQVQQLEIKENQGPVIFEICEPYYESIVAGKKCLIIHEGYEPLHIGEVYRFVLDPKGKQITGVWQIAKNFHEITQSGTQQMSLNKKKMLRHNIG